MCIDGVGGCLLIRANARFSTVDRDRTLLEVVEQGLVDLGGRHEHLRMERLAAELVADAGERVDEILQRLEVFVGLLYLIGCLFILLDGHARYTNVNILCGVKL